MEIFTSEAHKKFLKEGFEKGEGQFGFLKMCLRHEAEKRMKNPLYSVTFTKGKAVSGDIHDYYSEAPYWWPDPKNPDGPFIRRDGEVYPGRFEAHHDAMGRLSTDTYILSVAGYLLDTPVYTERAAKLIDTWFLNEETKMNPHLDYAQAIYKITPGRGIGIIDTELLIRIVAGMDFFTESKGYEEITEGLKAWLRDYVKWMDTGKNGIEERDYFNNHANWWGAQVASFAAFYGDSDMVKRCGERFLGKILPEQTGKDGEFTDELTRTNSYHYTLYNLAASAVTAEAVRSVGMDLWNSSLPDGRGLKKSLEFMLPYYENPFLWRHKQISGTNITPQMPFILAKTRLGGEFENIGKARKNGFYPFSAISQIGAVCLLEGYL